MDVTYFFRKPQPQYHSIERVFHLVIDHLPGDVDAKIYRLKSGDKGIWSRIQALLETRKNKGAVNHITGDISYVALALPRKGLVITFHDLESLQRRSGVKNKLLRWFWVTLPARRAALVTVISEHTRQKVMEWAKIPAGKIKVIPNPLPHGFEFSPKNSISKVPHILAMGTKYNKNLEGTIAALEGIKCRLTVVGALSAHQKRLLEERKVEYENLVGVDDRTIAEAYRACDLLCFPSFFEGFGMPIIEAQATGRPVITSNRGAMKEVAGGAALLVDPEDVTGIREALLSLINDEALRCKLVEDGRKNAGRFEAGFVADCYAEVYRGL